MRKLLPYALIATICFGLSAAWSGESIRIDKATIGGLVYDSAGAPNPGAGVRGGVKSQSATTHEFVNGLGTDGVLTHAQPSCSDLSNASAMCSSASASSLSSGTLAAARGGAGTVNGALKGNGSGAVSQAACADLSNAAASCATDATNASNIGSGTLSSARLPALAIGATVKRTTTQTITSGVGAVISFPTLVKDDSTFWSSGADTKLTAPSTGWYLVTATCVWDSNATGIRVLELRLNGSTYFNGTGIAGSNSRTRNSSTMIWYMTAGDYFEVAVFQDSGGNRTVDGAFNAAWFSMVKLP